MSPVLAIIPVGMHAFAGISGQTVEWRELAGSELTPSGDAYARADVHVLGVKWPFSHQEPELPGIAGSRVRGQCMTKTRFFK
jgi:hypothetical protein